MIPFKRKPGYLKDEGIVGIIALAGVVIVGFFVVKLIQFIIANIMVFYLILFIILLATGFVNIPLGHKGLLIKLGKRTNREFNEGINWYFPLITRIEIIDCRERFVKGSNMRLSLANLIPVNMFVSAYFKIDNLYNYFENYSTSDFESKVNSDLMKNLREFLTQDEINEKELQNIRSVKFRNSQIDQINSDYLYRLGIKITNITIESIHLEHDMELFYSMIRQADILALERKMTYTDALKTSLILNNKVGSSYNNINLGTETMIEGLKQLKRLKVLANE